MVKKVKKAKPALKKSEPKMVLVNVKISLGVKNNLKAQANRYAKGNVTKLIRLVANGKLKPVQTVKAA